MLSYLLSLSLLLLTTPMLARAQSQRPGVAIDVDDCVPVDHQKLHRLLAIELSGAQVGAPDASTRVSIGCAKRGIALRLEDRLTGKSMQRLLPKASFRDEASTRLLALATAEFVVASWIELNVRRPATVALAAPTDATFQASAERIATERLEPAPYRTSSLSAGFVTRLWAPQGTPFFGGNVRWLHGIAPHLAWTAAADVGGARATALGGSISAVTAALSVAVAMQVQFDRLELHTGPGASVGLASLTGHSDDGRLRGYHFTALYAEPLWFNRLAFRASRRLLFALELELGLTILPVHGTAPTAASLEPGAQDDVFELDGVSLAAGASLGFTL